MESGMLRGRHRERQGFDDLLTAVAAGDSRSLVLQGEAGIGKTALLDHLGTAAAAAGCRVLRISGFEAESELVFAALHQLCRPLIDRLPLLPPPQRTALSGALGLSTAESGDRFMVALAVLTLLAEAAGDRPLVCIVDDAQWLDDASAQALGFVARRLGAESVALVFAVRVSGVPAALAGLTEMPVRGLSYDESAELLGSTLPTPLDERVRERIIVETRGNPLAIIELSRHWAPHEVGGGFGVPAGQPVPGRVEASFQARLAALPDDTRLLLLTAAAEPTGESPLLWRAAELLGIGPGAAAPAEVDGLLQFDPGISFRHPLVRSAVYSSATAPDRRRVHEALADATDPHDDPDRRAWHRARAALRPDETVAAELESSAERAAARGGLAAAAAFLRRAATLTPGAEQRARRTLAAARTSLDAGAAEQAGGLISTIDPARLGDKDRAVLLRLRGQLAFHLRRGGDAVPLLLEAARMLQPLDGALARETCLEALWSTILAGRLGPPGASMIAAGNAVALARPAGTGGAVDLLLLALGTRILHGYDAAVPILRDTVDSFRSGGLPIGDQVRWLWLASSIVTDLWDDDSWAVLAERHVQVCRDAGALTVLPFALNYLALVEMHAGHLRSAAALIEEADTICAATGAAPLAYSSLSLVAWRGDQSRESALILTGARDAIARDEGRAVTVADLAGAILHNGLGQYDAALEAAVRACADDELGFGAFAPHELIEAAVRSGRRDLAVTTMDSLGPRCVAAGSSWALGMRARSAALLAEGAEAERLYREAIEQLGRCRGEIHLARAHLLYGEWLRRARRRADSREQLRTALTAFEAMGAEAFAQRTTRELLATGERARRRVAETASDLTAQESQIATLAGGGHSNADIGARLFISPRTVEYHLHKVYTKLGVGSRLELKCALPD
jgi:DNA-binding CsgD family transcriptional regulator